VLLLNGSCVSSSNNITINVRVNNGKVIEYVMSQT
jgi:hypothetical protein